MTSTTNTVETAKTMETAKNPADIQTAADVKTMNAVEAVTAAKTAEASADTVTDTKPAAPTIKDMKTALEKAFDTTGKKSMTVKAFWKVYADLNFAVTPTTRHFKAAFGEENGAKYAARVRDVVNDFIAVLINYEAAREAGCEDIAARRDDAFNAFRGILAMCGYNNGMEVGYTAAVIDTFAARCYNFRYADKSDLTKGYEARVSGAWALFGFMMKYITTPAAVENAARAALEKKAKREAREAARRLKMDKGEKAAADKIAKISAAAVGDIAKASDVYEKEEAARREAEKAVEKSA